MAARDDFELNGADLNGAETFYSGILPASQAAAEPTGVRVAQATANVPPATVVIALEDGNIARLPAGADISNARANGADLEFVQPDGTVIVITGGAIANLVLFIGDIQIPAEAVAQIFAANDIQTAAGPEGGNTTPDGASGSFSDPGETNVGDGFRQNSLLGNSELPFNGVDGEDPPTNGNSRPIIVSILGGNVSEEGLAPLGLKDTNGAPGDSTDSATLTGTVVVTDDGGPLTFSFGIPAGTFTSGGLPISWTAAGGTLLGTVGAPAVTVFTATITSTGAWTVTLSGPFDHPIAGTEDTLSLLLPVTVTDTGGLSASGMLQIGIEDDSPQLSTGKPVGLLVDEDDIDTSGSLGSAPNDGDGPDGSFTGTPGQNTGGPSNASGNLAVLVNAGADGGLTFGLRDDAAVRTFMEAQLLSSEGDLLSYQVVGNTLYGFANLAGPNGLIYNAGQDRLVFTLEVTESTGDFTFSLYDQLDHDKLSLDMSLAIDFGAVLQATDFDKDPVTLSGMVTVNVTDDVPYLSGKGTTLTVDEDDIRTAGSVGTSPNDGNGDGSYTGQAGVNNPGPANATGSLVGLVASSGADDALTYGFLADGTVRTLMLAQGLASEGEPLSYQVVGGTLYGFVNAGAPGVIYNNGLDRLVFTLEVNPTTGVYTFSLHDQLDHNKQSHDSTLAIQFGSVLQVVDFDDDAVTLTGKVTVNVTDDVPTLSNGTSSLTVDEDDIRTAGSVGTSPNDGNGDGSFTGVAGVNNPGPANATGSLAGLVANSGADDPVTFAFRSDNDVRAHLLAQGLKSEGESLSYQVVGNMLYGFVNLGGPGTVYHDSLDRLVFTLEVNPATGAYTFSLHDQLDHTGQGNTNLSTLAIDFGSTLQAVDFDKDAVILAGKVTVNITDDVPTLNTTTTTLTVDEDDIRVTGGSIGSSPNDGNGDGSFTGLSGDNNPGPAKATGSLAGLVASSGADDPVTFAFRSDSDVRAHLLAQGLKSEGEALSYQVVGNILYGFVNLGQPGTVYNDGQDRLVFTLEVTPTTGAYTFSLHDQLDHNGLGNTNLSTLAIDFGSALQAVDFDKDAVILAGKVTVNITDDVPALNNKTTSLTVDEDDIRVTGGSIGSSPNDGNGDGSFTGLSGDNNPGPAKATGSLAGLVAASGADDPVTFGFLSDTAVRAHMEAQTLKSEGEALSYQVVGNILYGFVNDGAPGVIYNTGLDRLVFTLEVNPTTGAYTFALHDQLDHNKNGQGTSIPIDFGGALQVLDFDKDGVTLTGRVTVNVTDDVPSATGESLTVQEDTSPLTIDLDTNDSSGADDPTSIQITSVTAAEGPNVPTWTPSGWLVGPNGVFSVTPPANWNGTLTVQYSVLDFDGDSKPATATITVTAVNDAPVIGGVVSGLVIESGDVADINEAGLSNPSAPSGQLGLEPRLTTSTSLAGLQTTPSSLPAVLGALIIELGNTAQAKAQAVAVIWDYLDDIYASAGPNQININEAFVRLGMEYAKLVQSGQIQPLLDVIAKYTPDGGDVDLLPQRVQNLHDNLLGNLSTAALDQRFHATNPTLEAQLAVDIGLIDPDLLTRAYFDGAQGVSDAPSRAWDLANGFATTATGQLTVNDPDQPSGHVWSIDGSAAGTYGSFSLDANGKWTYVLDNADVDTQALKGGQAATETFTVKVTDAFGASSTQVVTINLTGSNDAPVITALQNAGSTLVGVVEADVGVNNRLEPGQNLDSTIQPLLVTGMNMAAILDAVQATLGAGASRAQAIVQVWDYIDDNYSYYDNLINEASARLAVEYARYLKAGGAPLLDVIAKYAPDGVDAGTNPDRQQSLHDNLLGNASSPGLMDKLLGAGNGGSNPNPAPATYQAILDLLTANGLSGLLTRPYYGGYEADTNNAYAWDLANGLFNQAAGQIMVSDVDQTSGVPFSFTADHTTGTYGDLILNPTTGQWSYAADPARIASLPQGQTASETFTITVTDDKGGFDTTTITVAATGGIELIQTTESFALQTYMRNLTLLDGASHTDTFSNFDLGPITDGENGWVVRGPNAARDQEVVDVGGSDGKVFRMSSDPSVGDFAGPYSIALPASAGEPSTTADYSAQSIKFRFKAVDPSGDNSRLEVDFGTAARTDRNNFMVIEATAAGIRIATNEPRLDGNWTTNTFTAFTGNITVANGLALSAWHEIELRLSYLDGPNNDRIQIYVDGVFAGITTTFENYRDYLGGTHAANAEANQTNSIFFRPSAGGAPNDGANGQNEGFYFDDLTTKVYDNSNGIGNGLENTINGNSGDNLLSGLGGDDFLSGGAGEDVLIGGVGNDTLVGGSNADTFRFAEVGAANKDTISDYVLAEGDKVDLSSLLDAAFTGGSLVADFVKVVGVGSNLTVQVDLDGAANGQAWTDVVDLANANTGGVDSVRVFFEGVEVIVTE